MNTLSTDTANVIDARALPKASGAVPSFSPLYQQIKQLLLKSLDTGEFKPGELIPSELELCSRFGVSQGTVRKAIDELAAEHLLIRKQGKGTFVATHAETQVQYRFLQLVPDTGDRNQEGPADRQIIDCRKVRASAELGKILGLPNGEPLLTARRVLSFAKTPTILEDIWLPGTPFKGLTSERLASHQGPLYALFEKEFGVRMVRATEKIRAVAATSTKAQLLQVAPGTPLLYVERVAYTYHDIAMELRRALYRTDTHYYKNDLS